MIIRYFLCTIVFLFFSCISHAIVKFDGNCFLIDGVLLLQDADDTLAYYYAPKYPTIAMKNDSTAEFLFMKYSGADDQSTGGLFHALIEFTISDQELANILKKLRKKIPKARLKGRLPFLPTNGVAGDFSGPTFEIVSSILSNNGGITRSVVTSGQAPMTPGSKAAVAASLDAQGATLFWKSLTSGPTSDISINVKAYYEAKLPSYNAIISVDMENIFSEFSNEQTNKKFFSQKDISNRVDSILKNGGMKIEVVDRSQALDVDNFDMQSLVELITTKVTDLMFGVSQGDLEPEEEYIEEEYPEEAAAGPMGMDPMTMMMMMQGMQGMAGNINTPSDANSAMDDDNDRQKSGQVGNAVDNDDNDTRQRSGQVGNDLDNDDNDTRKRSGQVGNAIDNDDNDTKQKTARVGNEIDTDADNNKSKANANKAITDKQNSALIDKEADANKAKANSNKAISDKQNSALIDKEADANKAKANANKAITDKQNSALIDKEAEAKKSTDANSSKGKSDKINSALIDKEAEANKSKINANPNKAITDKQNTALIDNEADAKKAKASSNKAITDKQNSALIDKEADANKAKADANKTKATANKAISDKQNSALIDNEVDAKKAKTVKASVDNNHVGSNNLSNHNNISGQNAGSSMRNNGISPGATASAASGAASAVSGAASAAAGVGAMGAMIGFMAINALVDKTLQNNKKQFVLNNKKEVKLTTYKVNLSKSNTIKVPFSTSGNLSFFYNSNKNDERYFSIVNMQDAAFQQREVAFQIDNEYADSFTDLLNFVTIRFKKSYSNGQTDVTKELMFNKNDILNGDIIKSLFYPRLGETGKNNQVYQYQIIWNLKGANQTLRFPENENEWMQSSEPVISLAPPFIREEINIDAERDRFSVEGYNSVNIRFASVLGGKPSQVKKLVLKANDPEWSSTISIYHDKNQPVVYESTWYSGADVLKQPMQLIDANYLFLIPPTKEKP